jgi:hypothetical protein
VLAHALLQWPYLSDMSLISAITSVFREDWGLAPKLPPSWLQLKRAPWLYFNLVITDSQVGVVWGWAGWGVGVAASCAGRTS